MRTSMRRCTVMAAAALTLGATSLITAPTTSAAVSDCPREYVCVWNNTSFAGAPDWKSKGSIEVDLHTSNGWSIVNNGVADPGADHIYYKVVWPHGSSGTGCLHYPPDDNTTRIDGAGIKSTLTYVRWGDAWPCD
ncbi:peptidase inhibitor family I36 protein [Streptomyces anulatus]|uniref:Peptidase inhibitor family I36 protein n=1 Tax=Streptomyces anulatus TaxID=1892 RepID=A0A6G3T0P5_STRAQ|nr:peptidase inhibitor family I36 protein [Streptomyces anulatus]NEB88846.1 hypothetical protein [Streptomyces anulatus]